MRPHSTAASDASPPPPSASSPTEPWRKLYPFESHFRTIDGFRCHYLDEGPLAPAAEAEPETILCVHGNPTWSFYWRSIVERFRSKARVVVPDHLGCGLSGKPQDYPYTLSKHVDNLLTLIHELDLRNITLVAHDWGGAIGLGAATAEPERFRRIVLTNTGAFRSREIPVRIAACRIPFLGEAAVRGLNGFAGAALFMASELPGGLPPDVKAGLIHPYDSWENRVAVMQFVQDIPLDARQPSFAKITEIERRLYWLNHLPIQLIWGMRDWCFTPHFLDRFTDEFFPQARVHRIARAGHYVLEDATEEVLEVLDTFFRSTPGPHPIEVETALASFAPVVPPKSIHESVPDAEAVTEFGSLREVTPESMRRMAERVRDRLGDASSGAAAAGSDAARRLLARLSGAEEAAVGSAQDPAGGLFGPPSLGGSAIRASALTGAALSAVGPRSGIAAAPPSPADDVRAPAAIAPLGGYIPERFRKSLESFWEALGPATPAAYTPRVYKPDDLVNVARRLTETAQRDPAGRAVVFPRDRDEHGRRKYEVVTFAQLDRESDRLARGLRKMGVEKGTRLALMVRPSVEFVALAFALFKAGAVAILIDPGMGRKHLLKCLDEAEPEGFIAIPLVHAVRTALLGRYPKAKHNVTVGRKLPLWDGITYQELLGEAWSGPVISDTLAEDPAAIIFTTGSTGPPKGVLYRHRCFDAQVDELRAVYDIRPGEVNLPGFPLFTLFDAALGVTTVVPDMDPTRPARVEPGLFVEAILDWEATQAFGSPAIWNRVGTWCAKYKITLPSLRRVLSAGAPVPPRVLKTMRSCLPADAKMFTPYGATESLPVASIESRTVLEETSLRSSEGAGTCVGKRFPGIEWKVIRIVPSPIATLAQAEELRPGEIGELIVSGSVVTDAYFRRPDATALAKIQDGGRVWHRMGDAGWLDDQDRFWFCGRIAHIVSTADGPRYSVPCEAVFNEHPRVYRTALVGVGPAGRRKPVLVVEPHPGQGPKDDADRKAFIAELKALGAQRPHTGVVDTFLFHPSFPVDVRHNAKIFREKLAVWASGTLGVTG